MWWDAVAYCGNKVGMGIHFVRIQWDENAPCGERVGMVMTCEGTGRVRMCTKHETCAKLLVWKIKLLPHWIADVVVPVSKLQYGSATSYKLGGHWPAASFRASLLFGHPKVYCLVTPENNLPGSRQESCKAGCQICKHWFASTMPWQLYHHVILYCHKNTIMCTIYAHNDED